MSSLRLKPSKKSFLIILPIFLIFLFFPFFVWAGWAEPIWRILGVLTIGIQSVLGAILFVFVKLLETLLLYNKFTLENGVVDGWGIIRDICNMFFILILLVIAFGTVMGVEAYQFRKLLLPFVLAVILINFSKMICGVIIDFANIITLTFMSGIGGAGLAEGLMTALRVPTFLQVPEGSIEDSMITDWDTFKTALWSTLFIFIFVVVIGAIVIFIAIRIVALWILIVLSPLAYIANILPTTKQYAGQWWDNFIKYVIYAPTMAFFLYLAVSIFAKKGVNLEKEIGIVEGKYQSESIIVFLSKAALPENFTNICLALAFLIGSLIIAQRLSIAGAGTVTGFAKGFITNLGPLRVKDRWQAYRAQRAAIRKEEIERFGKRISNWQDMLTNIAFLLKKKEEKARMREDKKTNIERVARLHNVNGMTPEELKVAARSRNANLRIAAGSRMLSEGLLKDASSENIDIVNRMKGDMRDVPEMWDEFKEGILKASPDLAAKTIYNKFTTFQDSDRFWSDVSRRRIDLSDALIGFDEGMIGSLNGVMESAGKGSLAFNVIKNAKDVRELESLKNSLSSKREGLIFGGANLHHEQFNELLEDKDQQKEMKEKATLATGRISQIWNLADGAQRKEAVGIVEANTKKIKENVSEDTLEDVRGLKLLEEVLKHSELEDITKRDKASLKAFSTGSKAIVDVLNKSEKYDDDANKARALHVVLSVDNKNRIGEAFDNTNKARKALTDLIKVAKIKGVDLAKIDVSTIPDALQHSIADGIEVSQIREILLEGNQNLVKTIQGILKKDALTNNDAKRKVKKMKQSEWSLII